MTDEELDRINRAEEIQRYTENRCEALEEENKELKAYNEKLLNSDIEKHNKIVELEAENRRIANDLLDDWCRNKDDYCPHLKALEKENAELKAQIKKMKCCQNCRKFNNLSYDCTCAKVCKEWELKE